MKHSREVLKRLVSAEKKLGATKQKKFAMRDFDGSYYVDCGHALSQEQFDAWVNQQDAQTELFVFAYSTMTEEGKLVE